MTGPEDTTPYEGAPLAGPFAEHFDSLQGSLPRKKVALAELCLHMVQRALGETVVLEAAEWVLLHNAVVEIVHGNEGASVLKGSTMHRDLLGLVTFVNGCVLARRAGR